MERVVEGIVEALEDPVLGDRRLRELDARQLQDVRPLGRQEVVDDPDPGRSLGVERTDEVGADKAGPADDEDGCPREALLRHQARSASSFRWVYVSVIPKVR
jgi:hypothetical protein